MPAVLSLALLFTLGGDPDSRPAAILIPATTQVASNPAAVSGKTTNPPWVVSEIRRQWERVCDAAAKPSQTLPSAYYLEDDVQYFTAPQATLPPPQAQPEPRTWSEYRTARDLTAVSKEQHLRHAADHLQAAGFQQESDALRKRADAESIVRKQRELAAKKRQLEQLKREIEALSAEVAPKSDRNLVMHISVVEVEDKVWREKLKPTLGEEELARTGEQGGFDGIVFHDADDWNNAVEELRESNQVKVLATPTIATIAGQQCSFQSGGQAPTAHKIDGELQLKMTPFGTKVSIRPNLGAGDDLKLEVDAAISALTGDSGETINGVKTNVVRNEFRASFGAAMKLGESIAIVSPLAKKQGDKREATTVRTVLVVHPEEMKPLNINALSPR